MWAKLLDTVFHRSLSFLIAAMFLLGLALWGAPQLLEVTVYKLGLVFASASAGYWIDRVTFPYARPDRLQNEIVDFDNEVPTVFAHAMIRRAIIMAACMICVGLGA